MSDMAETRTPVWTLGELIRKAREDMGWKQSDLAMRLRVGRATIASWENNVNRPNFASLRLLADLTDYPVHFFTGGDDDPVNGPGTPGYWANPLLVAA